MQSAELGSGRVLDVLQYYPRDYLEYEYDIAEDQHVTLLGTVTKLKSDTIFRKRMSRLDVTLLVDPNALKPAEAESNPELDAPLPSGEPSPTHHKMCHCTRGARCSYHRDVHVHLHSQNRHLLDFQCLVEMDVVTYTASLTALGCEQSGCWQSVSDGEPLDVVNRR